MKQSVILSEANAQHSHSRRTLSLYPEILQGDQASISLGRFAARILSPRSTSSNLVISQMLSRRT
jgi:hypothetical protein